MLRTTLLLSILLAGVAQAGNHSIVCELPEQSFKKISRLELSINADGAGTANIFQINPHVPEAEGREELPRSGAAYQTKSEADEEIFHFDEFSYGKDSSGSELQKEVILVRRQHSNGVTWNFRQMQSAASPDTRRIADATCHPEAVLLEARRINCTESAN